MRQSADMDLVTASIIEGIAQLIELACSDDEETSIRAFEELQFIRTNRTEKCVLEGLKSQSTLVCITCLEIVGEWRFLPALELARCYIKHSDPLVRSEAIIAIAKCSIESDKVLLKTQFAKELDKEVLHIYYYAFSVMEEKKYLCFFLAGLFDEDYHIRCATANLIDDVVSIENSEVIKRYLSVATQGEEVRACLDAFKSAHKRL